MTYLSQNFPSFKFILLAAEFCLLSGKSIFKFEIIWRIQRSGARAELTDGKTIGEKI
jgi:hypothetical protein